LREQFAARVNAYRNAFPGANHSIVLLGRTSVGVLIVHRIPAEIRIVDLALLPARRGAGLGTWLLRQLMDEACGARLPLRLQVLKGSPALRLYLRLGFSPAGENGLYLKLEWHAPVAAPRPEAPR
jgi:GNAT superfamily N-acetyltransferase